MGLKWPYGCRSVPREKPDASTCDKTRSCLRRLAHGRRRLTASPCLQLLNPLSPVCQPAPTQALTKRTTPTGNEVNHIRILVADEQPVPRYALRQLLEAERDFQVIGEASDAVTAARLARQFKPDVLLLDLALTRRKELQTSGGLASYLSPTRVVIMVTAIETAQIIEAFRLQADGIVLKTSAPRAWFTSIRSVIACNYCIGGQSVALLAEAFHDFLRQRNGAIPPKDYGLTRREMDIVAQVATGRSNREIGQDLSIGERTVKQHVTNIFNKIGVSNRVELALFAVNNRLPQAPTSVSKCMAAPLSGAARKTVGDAAKRRWAAIKAGEAPSPFAKAKRAEAANGQRNRQAEQPRTSALTQVPQVRASPLRRRAKMTTVSVSEGNLVFEADG